MRIALRRGTFDKRKSLKFILLPGASPPGLPTGLCPCTPLGAAQAPRPLAKAGAYGPQCRLLSKNLLLLLKIILTTLCFGLDSRSDQSTTHRNLLDKLHVHVVNRKVKSKPWVGELKSARNPPKMF